jgi:hypothetical protein
MALRLRLRAVPLSAGIASASHNSQPDFARPKLPAAGVAPSSAVGAEALAVRATKTVLAKALTEDEVVQRAFPDGIVWITAGEERKRDFIEEMREVAKALGDDLSRYDHALACQNQCRTTIANKAALIVVDDV